MSLEGPKCRGLTHTQHNITLRKIWEVTYFLLHFPANITYYMLSECFRISLEIICFLKVLL